MTCIETMYATHNVQPAPVSLGLPRTRVSVSRLMVALVPILCLAGTALGQFVVQPMLIEYQPRPNTLLKTEIQLQNWTRDRTQTVSISVVDLSQRDNGSWWPLSEDEERAAVDLTKLASCRDWIEVDVNAADIPPMAVRPVGVKIRVPPRARGFYCAALVASVLPPESDVGGVSVRYDLVSPVLLQVAGTNLRSDITLTDVGLDFQAGDLFSQQDMGNTDVILAVENNGNTYSRLQGYAQVRALMENDRWRVIAPNVEFKKVPIIPGSRLRLRADLEQVLPTGQYKVSGILLVDGHRIPGVEKDVAYEGPARATRVTAQAVIRTDPDVVFIDAQPGRVRTGRVTLYNHSGKTLNMRAYVTVPEAFGGRVLPGNVMGEDLACADWVEVRPAEFQIAGYGKKTLRLTCRMPSVERHSFYGDLRLLGSYAEDGSNAGRTSAMVVVTNEKAPAQYGIREKSLDLKELAGSKYVVSARYTNIGTVHVNPRVLVRAIKTVGNNNQVVASAVMDSEGDRGLMLPVESRDFAAVLDFTTVAPGNYTLQAELVYGKGTNDSQLIQRPIIVWQENGKTNAAWDTTAAAVNATGTRGGSVSW